MKKLKGIMDGLAREYSAIDILMAFSDSTGVKLSKTQIKYAGGNDEEMEYGQFRLCEWEERGEKIYTADDFPEFVGEEILNYYGKSIDGHDLVKKVLNGLSEKAPILNNFVSCRGKTYFNQEGYFFIISRSVGEHIINREIASRWTATILNPDAVK